MNMTIEQTLQKAIKDHKAGNLQDAEVGYSTILEIQPNNPDANHNLGLIAITMNKPELALLLFKTSLEINPNEGQFWISYVDVLIKTNQLDIAKQVIEKGKKLGLAGEKVDILEAKMKSIALEQKSKSVLKDQKLSFTQQRKMVSAKKEKKVNSSLNKTNLYQLSNPSQIEVNDLLKNYQKGRYDLAENLAKTIILKYPDNQLGWKALGAIFKKTGRLQESLLTSQRAVTILPNDAESHYNLGVTLKELGRLEDAQASYKKAISIKPEFVEAHRNLGNTLRYLGRLEDAENSYKKAIEIKPDYAEAHSNLGVTLQELGRLEDAEASYKEAIAINPGLAEAHSNLGTTLKELGRLEAAEASYKKAIAINPALSEVHNNLGNTLKELGRLKDAEASYIKAITINPDLAEAYSNLGSTLKELGRLEAAEASYKKAIAIKPDFVEAHYNLGVTLKELGKLEDAITTVIKTIKIKPSAEAKSLFVILTQEIKIENWNQTLADLVITALLEPWGRPSEIVPIACRLLKSNDEFLYILKESKNNIFEHYYKESFLRLIFQKELGIFNLLRAILSSSVIPDLEIEIFLTSLRRHFLYIAESIILKDGKTEGISSLFCSLAKQCFINEYVYFQTPEEIRRSQQLHDRLTMAIEGKENIPEVWIIAVACYFPLYSVIGIEILSQEKWSDDVKSVLKQQIQDPLEETILRASIPVLTSIDDQVSLTVQIQYEENPYPRWMFLPKHSNKKFLNSDIQSRFPLSLFSRLSDDRNPEILIAGCGTGQHSIITSQQFKGAKILAVDLSMASLAYAKRKTAELDITSINYAQADLLKLSSLGRTFDVIESVGVLHHLENPFEGWKILLSLLRPHGLMRLGFYSELARHDIVRVRDLISKEGIGSSANEIRDYRKHLLGLKDFENYGFATSSSDFFSISACRDLLFHVQESRMNLKVLDGFLKDHRLNFLGFDINSSVSRAYKNYFPNDPSATILDQWHIFEEKNPNSFIGMYQFWVQKIRT